MQLYSTIRLAFKIIFREGQKNFRYFWMTRHADHEIHFHHPAVIPRLLHSSKVQFPPRVPGHVILSPSIDQ